MRFSVPKLCPKSRSALNLVHGEYCEPMSLTAYHAKLFAHELTKRSSSDDVDKLASALSDAQVDLNPHQIEAALFAFRSPLSKGAILADEVGLGKTIEAGILLAQRRTRYSIISRVVTAPTTAKNGSMLSTNRAWQAPSRCTRSSSG